jgi:hypothetical protein
MATRAMVMPYETLTTLAGQNYSNEQRSREQRKSKKPEIPSHYPELITENGELEEKVASRQREQR